MAAYLIDGADLGESTSTSSTFASKLAVTPTLVDGTTYLIIWSCEVQNNNASGRVDVRLFDATGAAALQTCASLPKDATDYIARGSMAVFTASASASREFRIEYNRTGFGTSAIRNARLLVIELDSGDFHSSSTGASTTNSGTHQDKITLSVNGAAAGDYWFIAGAMTATDTNNIEIQGLETDGTTAVNPAGGFIISSGSFSAPYSVQWVETLDGSNVSAKLQYRSLDGDDVAIQNAYLAAINLASLGDSYAFTLSETDDAGTSSVAGDSETLEGSGVDTVGGDVLVVAVASYSGDSTSVSSAIDFREASTTLIESFHEDRGSARDVVAIIGYKSSSSNDPETWSWRRRSESGSSTTTTVKHASIIAVGLTASGSTDYIETANDGAIVIAPKIATLLIDANLTAIKGAITINGQPATITADTGYQETATKGTVTFTGQGATLLLDQNLDAGAGAIVINGQAATVETGQPAELDAGAGAIVINGQPATILAEMSYIETATAGAIVINGQPPVLVVDANLAASAGAIAIAGKAATITITTDTVPLNAGMRRIGVNGMPGYIYTENNGGSVTVIENATDGPPGTNWDVMVREADRDYEVSNDRPIIYRFGRPDPQDRRFERVRPEYEDFQ